MAGCSPAAAGSSGGGGQRCTRCRRRCSCGSSSGSRGRSSGQAGALWTPAGTRFGRAQRRSLPHSSRCAAQAHLAHRGLEHSWRRRLHTHALGFSVLALHPSSSSSVWASEALCGGRTGRHALGWRLPGCSWHAPFRTWRGGGLCCRAKRLAPGVTRGVRRRRVSAAGRAQLCAGCLLLVAGCWLLVSLQHGWLSVTRSSLACPFATRNSRCGWTCAGNARRCWSPRTLSARLLLSKRRAARLPLHCFQQSRPAAGAAEAAVLRAPLCPRRNSLRTSSARSSAGCMMSPVSAPRRWQVLAPVDASGLVAGGLVMLI